jgi:hypothetical protein
MRIFTRSGHTRDRVKIPPASEMAAISPLPEQRKLAKVQLRRSFLISFAGLLGAKSASGTKRLRITTNQSGWTPQMTVDPIPGRAFLGPIFALLPTLVGDSFLRLRFLDPAVSLHYNQRSLCHSRAYLAMRSHAFCKYPQRPHYGNCPLL